jgi:hypothetical protein
MGVVKFFAYNGWKRKRGREATEVGYIPLYLIFCALAWDIG